LTDHTPDSWRRTLRRRLFAAAAGLLLWAVGIEARLVSLQVYRHAELQARAERQQMRTVAVPAKRGEILDRQGRVLAYSVDADSIYAVPTEIADPARVASLLCGALEDCGPKEQQGLLERLGRPRAFAFVRRQASPAEARRVAQLNLEGIGFIKENQRFYPKKELAAHVLGYVGVDNAGLSGLEAAYDAQIRGSQGTILIQTDARRHAFSRLERPPTAGATIELTIDANLQYVVERELRDGVAANRAAGGTAIVMNPRTGEILALASEPTFNPNAFRDAQEVQRRNRAVQDIYEPGSTFKVVTASAALEEHVWGVDDLIDASAGSIRFGSRTIDDVHAYGVLSFTDVIVKSSNVGAIKIGLKVGPERLGRYIRRFGFGSTLSPDFPGENPGIVWDPGKLDQSALASVSMGYQVSVTALQMVSAVSSVANGGELIEPRVVHALVRDGRRTEVRPRPLGRTVSAATAAELTAIMEAVVERGTATLAKIPGYTIAGKTGTAAKLVNGRYSQSEYNASFVGFLPSRDPVAAVIVVIDSPHADQYYGGSVAAPIFKRIAEAALRQLGVSPTVNPAPPVLVAHRAEEPETAPARVVVMPATAALGRQPAPQNLPDVRGLSAREALRTLTRIGLTARIAGSGFVVGQDPAPGTPIDPGTICQLWLDRLAPDATSLPVRP
jgi:cell division protein FtsI (penicillin-binding protein 3)